MNNNPKSTLRLEFLLSTAFKNHSIQNVTINWKLYDIDDFEV